MPTEPHLKLTAVDCVNKLRQQMYRTRSDVHTPSLTLSHKDAAFGLIVGFRSHGRTFDIITRDRPDLGLGERVTRSRTGVSVRLNYGCMPLPVPVDGSYVDEYEFLRAVADTAVSLLEMETKKLAEYSEHIQRTNQLVYSFMSKA